MGATQMLTQGYRNSINLQNRENACVMWHGLPHGLQASSHGARKIPGTVPNRKSVIKIAKQDCDTYSFFGKATQQD